MIWKVAQAGLWNRLPIDKNMFFNSEEEAREYFRYAVKQLSEHCIVSEEKNSVQIHGPETAIKITLIPGDPKGIQETMDVWSTFFHVRDEYYVEVVTDALDEKSISYLYEAAGEHRKIPLLIFNTDMMDPEEIMALSRDNAEDAILRLEEETTE